MGQTITEKILSRVMARPVKAGETVYPVPDLMTVHDWYVVNFDKALQEQGVTQLFDPKRVLISTDHEPVATNPANAERQKHVREIVRKYGITQFFDVWTRRSRPHLPDGNGADHAGHVRARL